MLTEWKKLEFAPLSSRDLFHTLSLSYAEFEEVSALNPEGGPLFSPYWLKGLEAYITWLRGEVADKTGHELLRIGLEISHFDKYVVEVLKRC